jgi:uncharacterized protein with GYD domain
MSLLLAEVLPSADITTTLDAVRDAAHSIGNEFVEAQVTAGQDRVFVIVESSNADAAADLQTALTAAGLHVDAVSPVRLVGADLADVKANRPSSGYLVEWDLPSGLTMDAYLARKKEKSPLYAQVPETTFQRTYVREDMLKCLCFYDAPDEAAVLRAREVVSAPVDRLHALADLPATTRD